MFSECLEILPTQTMHGCFRTNPSNYPFPLFDLPDQRGLSTLSPIIMIWKIAIFDTFGGRDPFFISMTTGVIFYYPPKQNYQRLHQLWSIPKGVPCNDPLDYGKKGNGSTFPPNQNMVIARVNSWNLVVVDNPFIRPYFLEKGEVYP